MKPSAIICLLLTNLFVGCDFTAINGGYKDIGTFNSRAEAQKQAINTILDKYNSLSTSGYYKVRYANRNSPPSEDPENAIWYSKKDSVLIFESDVHSGPMCKWKQVSRAVLEQASRSNTSLATVDSLAKPDRPFSQCR